MRQRFESKRDWWLVLLLWATVIGMAVVAWDALSAPQPEQAITLTVSVLTAVFILWLMHGTYYEVGEGQLTVRAGPFRWRVPLEQITGVRPTRAPWSSPAMSLDRLRIDYGQRRWILVSPERREAFVEALGQKIPMAKSE